ncbi:MAG: coiled-coil domain-containing protein [Limnochordia bacterium]
MNSLYSYALAKSLYESNKDYLDTFVPFVCMVLADHASSLRVSSIKDGLKKRFQLSIPDHVLDEVCGRGISKGYLSRYDGYYAVTLEGQSYTGQVLSERDVERKANHLAERFSQYLARSDHQGIEPEQALELLVSFINRNLAPLTSFLETPQVDLANGSSDAYTRIIVKFIVDAEKTYPDLFEILSDLVYGSVICTVVQAQRDYIPQTLKGVKVFLDSNIVFSFLDFDHDEVARPRKELLHLLRKEDCELLVFDFTLDEMVSVLRGYPIYCDNLWSQVRVNSIYSNLRRRGKTPQDIVSIIGNLDKSLLDHGISVLKTKHDLHSRPRTLDLAPLVPYKVDRNDRSLYHDMLAIDEIQRLRDHQRVRKLEESQVLFVSADVGLSKYDLEMNNHRESSSIPNVMLDRILTQILWVKNPINSSLPLYSAIAAHSRTLFVDRNVWRKFCQIVSSMYEQSASEELSLLVYNAQLEDILARANDPAIIDEEFIMSQANKIRRDMEEERKQSEQQRSILVKTLEREKSEATSAQDELQKTREKKAASEKELARLQECIHGDAERKAELTIRCAINLVTAFLTVCIFYIWNKWKIAGQVVAAITVLTFLGVKMDVVGIQEKLFKPIKERIYRNHIKKYH